MTLKVIGNDAVYAENVGNTKSILCFEDIVYIVPKLEHNCQYVCRNKNIE